MDYEVFLNQPTSMIAHLVREQGKKVCVFPINGTRRWYLLEHQGTTTDSAESYLEAMIQVYVDIFTKVFQHGIHTILTPAFGKDLMDRGEEYMKVAAAGFAQLATHPRFLSFYKKYGVRVRFYGDYQRFFKNTPYDYLIDVFDQLMLETRDHSAHRLFFGLFASDATDYVIETSVEYFAQHQEMPSKEQIITSYYGEPIGSVDIFIGFDRFAAFDMPLLGDGMEDLYFAVSPSPYFTSRQLRTILYDHLFSRTQESDYSKLTEVELKKLRDFYRQNKDHVQGVGRLFAGIWYPIIQLNGDLVNC